MDLEEFNELISSDLVSNEERNRRWNICRVCEKLAFEYVGGFSTAEEFKQYTSDETRKNCEEEGTIAHWFTQFSGAKCPLDKW
jgi:hypothetical protein